MNDKESEILILINYNDKSFSLKSKDFLELKEIKDNSIKKFNIPKDKENLIKFYLANKKNIIIDSDNEIIKYLDDTNPDLLKLELYLSIEEKKIINNLIQQDNIQKPEEIKKFKSEIINSNNQNPLNNTTNINESSNKKKFNSLELFKILLNEIKTIKYKYEKQIEENKNQIKDLTNKNEAMEKKIENLNNQILQIRKENNVLKTFIQDVVKRFNNLEKNNLNKDKVLTPPKEKEESKNIKQEQNEINNKIKNEKTADKIKNNDEIIKETDKNNNNSSSSIKNNAKNINIEEQNNLNETNSKISTTPIKEQLYASPKEDKKSSILNSNKEKNKKIGNIPKLNLNNAINNCQNKEQNKEIKESNNQDLNLNNKCNSEIKIKNKNLEENTNSIENEKEIVCKTDRIDIDKIKKFRKEIGESYLKEFSDEKIYEKYELYKGDKNRILIDLKLGFSGYFK